jgi:hypothetical protein
LDERTLGSSDFVERLHAEPTEQACATVRSVRQLVDLEALARRVAAREGVNRKVSFNTNVP